MSLLITYLRRLAFYLCIALILLYILFPAYWMFISSFKNPTTIFTVDYLPTGISLINYRLLAQDTPFFRAIHNSVIVGVAVAALTLAIGSLAAYALGRVRFRGRRLTRHAIMVMFVFPHISILGSLYLLMSNPCSIVGGSCNEWGLYNTLRVLIISYLVLTLPLTVWFLAAYYRDLPYELEEAAAVDGATPFQVFTRIMLPLTAPGLITTGLLTFITSWNEFLFALTFTQPEQSWTAPVAISMYGDLGQGMLLTLAASMLVTGPIMILALTFQRQITAGLTGITAQESAEDGWLGRQLRRRGLPQIQLSAPARVVLLVLGLAALVFVAHGWNVIAFPYPIDYGEGPLLDQATRLARFQNIYRPSTATPPYTIANYPPLYPLTQAPLVWLFGPAFWYGRLLSWLSMVAAALLIALILHALTGDRLAAAIGGLTLLAIPYVSFWAPLYRVDPLALALSLGGIFVIVRRPDARWTLPLTAGLLVAAVYTRQSYGLAAPAAVFVWLLSRQPRRRALVFAALLGGIGLGLFALLNLLTGGGFFFNIVTANVNEYRLDLLQEYLGELWVFMPYLLLSSALFVLLAGWFRVRSWSLVAPYFVGAALSGLTIGKVGSNVNYFLELSAAMSLAIGAFIAWQRPRPAARHALMLILALQLFLLLPGMRYHLFTELKLGQSEDQARLMQIIRSSDGPVLADEEMGLLALDQRPLYFQPFEMTQLARDGVWDQAPLLAAIDRQQFAAIMILMLPTPPIHRDRWTDEMLNQIDRRYEAAEIVGNTVVYRPKQQ